MANLNTYNILISRFEKFADGHYLINDFSHGEQADKDLLKEQRYPYMHVVMNNANYPTNEAEWSWSILFIDLTRDKTEKIDNSKNVLSDMIQIAEDLLSEMINGGNLFGSDCEVTPGATLTPLIQWGEQAGTGVRLDFSFRFTFDFDSCDIPADYVAVSDGTTRGQSVRLSAIPVYEDGVFVGNATALDFTNGASLSIDGDGKVFIDITGGGGGGTQDLQQVTDEGNTTTNDIQLINDAEVIFGAGGGVLLDNGSRLREGTIDAGTGGSKGISQICGVGYELKWEAGSQYVMNGNGDQIREVNHKFNITPAVTDDSSKGFYVDSRWILDNGDIYICTDASIGAATWELQTIEHPVNADWNAITGLAEILNKPTIPTATSDLTNDSGFIVIGDVPSQVNSDWNSSSGASEILNKPSIPAAQIQSDWTQSNNALLDYIKNKPTLPATIGDMTKAVYDTDNDGVVDFAEALKTEVRNSTGATLNKGHIIYLSGSTGNLPNAVLARANAESTSAQTFGVVLEDIANNSNGYVVTIGQINTLDTRTSATNPFTSDTLVDGQVIYLSPTTAGHITNVKPSAPNHIVYVGYVIRTSPTNGTIQYRIQNGYELDEIHDVAISSVANDQALVYESATSLWKNKAFSVITSFLSAVRGTALTGLSTATSTIIDATDTVLSAFGKLQAQINSISGATSVPVKSNVIISYSGGTAEVKMFSVKIPAGTFQSNDQFHYWLKLGQSPFNANNKTFRAYFNTSDAIGGTQVYAFVINTSTMQYIHSDRRIIFQNSLSSQRILTAAGSYMLETANNPSAPSVATTINFAVDQWFVFTGQLATGTDTLICYALGSQITR